MLDFAWKGQDRVFGNIKRVARGSPQQLARAEYRTMIPEVEEMKRRTPVWNPRRPLPYGHTPGSLRASGTLHEPEIRGNQVSVAITFGNETVDYAMVVHEDLEAFHATGQAKYAESVMNESKPYIGRRIAAEMRLDELVE